MGDEVLLSMKHLNVIGDMKLVCRFVGPFSIVQQVGLLDYQLNMATLHSQVHPIFYISLLKPFHAGGDGYPHPIAVYVKDKQKWEVSGYLDIKD